MSFAFLFLTYDNIIFEKKYITFLNNKQINIYIHPKYPDLISSIFKKFIITNLVSTSWADISIVQASLNLLAEAYKNPDNKWFVLLPQDAFPLYNYNNFINRFNKIQNNRNLSIFKFHAKINNYWKTSQWWILNRKDTQIILESSSKYINLINRLSSSAADEIFFLSVLKLNNPNYEFINIRCMYDRWLKNTVVKNPIYFNKLTYKDIKLIKHQKSLFIRKVLPTFSVKKYFPRNKLFLIFIGDQTDQFKYNDFVNNNDYIIVTPLHISKINNNLLNNSINVINIIFSNYMQSIIAIFTTFQKILIQWHDGIVYIPETFNIINFDKYFNTKSSNYKLLNIDTNNSVINNFINNNKFYHIYDDKNNTALYLK
jgi:hypothetical protein